MHHKLPTITLLFLLSTVSVNAETQAEESDLATSVEEEATVTPSDGLAECAAILVAASSKSTNIIYRNQMRNSSSNWFATSGDLAIEESGEIIEDGAWETKVSDWFGRIGSVDAMAQHRDWMVYCSELGKQHGLDTVFFITEAQ